MNQFDLSHIKHDDKDVWNLIQSGHTCGVFQCESYLVQSRLREIKPSNIWELSAVIALVRPGSLSFVAEYIHNKENPDDLSLFNNEIIDNILKSTNGILIYQESLMMLGAKLAWPHLGDQEKALNVDILRKAVGKKDQQKILEIGKEFLNGCSINKVDTEISAKLFEIIKQCGRYAFNLSHSIAYAHVAYKTAYIKYHYPLQFLCTYLTYTKFKLKPKEELFKLLQESKLFNISILPPNFNKHNVNFVIEDNKIRYGLGFIKYFGSELSENIANIPEIKTILNFIYLAFTDKFGIKLRSNTTESLILAGAFNDIGLSRSSLMSVYELFSELTERELQFVLNKMENNQDINDAIISCVNDLCSSKRGSIVKSALSFLNLSHKDTFAFIEKIEKDKLGVSLTCSSANSVHVDNANKCIECTGENHNLYEKKKLVVVVDKVFLTETKRGKNPGQRMARINVSDDSYALNGIPVFPQKWDQYSDHLKEKNIVVLVVFYKNGWILDKVLST